MLTEETNERRLIAEARTVAAQFTRLRAPTLAALAAIEACADLKDRSAASIASKLDVAKDDLFAGAEQAGRNIRGSLAAVEAEKAKWLRNAEDGLRARVSAGFAKKAGELADAAVAACCALDDDLRRAALEATDPNAGSPKDLASILIEERERESYKGDGVPMFAARYASFAELGDDAQCARLERIGRPFLQEILRTPRPKLATTNGNNRAGEAEAMIEGAQLLLGMFENARQRRIPAEIGIAKQLRDTHVVGIFVSVLGVSAWSMPQAAWDAIMRGAASPPADWALSSDWLTRERSRRPAWSPTLGAPTGMRLDGAS